VFPGPYTLSGRLLPNDKYKDRYAITEALLPIIRSELEALVAAGCTEITVDEPSMSCYAYKEDTKRFVDIFNRTVKPIVGKCNLSTHLCFGNFKGRPVGYRSIKPMLPDFLDMTVDEIHIEMANREFAEIELLKPFAEKMHVAVGIIDVKNYYIETVDDVVERINRCLKYVPAEKLSVAPDCGLSQTARWASRQKLINMVKGAKKVREVIVYSFSLSLYTMLIKAVKKDEELIAEMDSLMKDENHFHLWWLGQSGFLLQWKGKRVLIDPYLSDSLTKKYLTTDKPHTRMSELVVKPELLKNISVVTSSHNHTDHLGCRNIDANFEK
jgi:hypothetical protein